MRTMFFTAVAVLLVGVYVFGIGWDRPPIQMVQHGYRGTGMELVYNPRTVQEQIPLNQVPEPIPAVENGGTPSREVYENVQVLGDVDSEQFTRIMSAMTEWIAPEQGCAYCHNQENMADGSMYTYQVARRMLQMTRHINSTWDSHVGQTGVTCYTCHRGQPVPANIWFGDPENTNARGALGDTAGQNRPAGAVGMASLPSDPFSPFLLDDQPIRVNGQTALPNGNRQSIKQAEWTYGLMIHMANSLGVNCTYCHNTRAISEWEQASPQRVSAWYGIRMTRDLNVAYLDPLQPVYPAHRLGPNGDAPKVNCTTCHAGAYKPLYGVSMLKDYPELGVTGAPQSAALGK